jgi:hypothetical protein
VLAGAWVAYNEKTIDVEVAVTTPACAVLLLGELQGLHTPALKRLIAQTQIDEQFHILMCLDACLLTRRMHGIEKLEFPKSLVSIELAAAITAAARPRDADLIRVAFAAVAEVTVNSYLDLLADDTVIQPFNRETTALHRHDESFHRDIYKEMVVRVFPSLEPSDREVFIRALTAGLKAFVKVDFRSWRAILDFVCPEAASVIVDMCEAGAPKRIVRDYSGFRGLLADIGVAEHTIDFDFEYCS